MAVLSLADTARLSDAYWQFDTRVALARDVLLVPRDGRYSHAHLWATEPEPWLTAGPKGRPSGPLLPHQYEYIWEIMVSGPMTAAEFAYCVAGLTHAPAQTAQQISNQLRPLVKRGWLTKHDATFDVTERARQAMSWL
jgi:hypothetical protein